MAVEGGAKIIKYLVVFFNFIFFLFGCALIGVGAWTLIEIGDYAVLSTVPYASASKVMIATGVFIALVAFFGCCGAWKENRCMLIIFFVILLVILALEIAAAVLGYQNRKKIETTLGEDFVKELETHYGEPDNKGTTDAIDALQRKESCCGWNGYRDWEKSEFTGQQPGIVPDSCCKTETEGCGKKTLILGNIYTEGCKDKLEALVKDKLYYIGAVAITVVVIQILGMIFAMVLICRIGQGTYA